MQRLFVSMLILVFAFSALPLVTGCERTLSEEKTVRENSSGGTTVTEKKVTENPDGSISKTEKKDVSNP